jgi:hypothetical protein
VEEAATRETIVKEVIKVLELTAPIITIESLDILLGTITYKIITRLYNRLICLPVKP